MRGRYGSLSEAWLAVGAVAALVLTIATAASAGCPDLVGRWSSGPVRAVDVDGTRLVLGRGSELVIADLAVPAATVEIGRLQLEGIPHDFAITGSIVLVAADEAGLVVVDVADSAHPFARASLPVGVHAEGVAAAGDHACVVDPWSGLHVIDVSDPANPVDVGSVDTTGYPYGVAVAGDHAYVAADSGGMVVVDISDPADPREVAALPIWGGAAAVAVVDHTVYVAAGSNGLVLVDVTDPATPTEVGQWGTTSIARDVAVRDGRAYLAGEGGGLHVVDVANPSQPSYVGSIDTPGYAFAVAVTAGTGIACVGDDFAGLAVIDLATEDIVASLPGAGESVGVAVDAGHAWVTDEAGFLRVLDVADPTLPSEVSAVATDATLGDLIVVDDHAYLASPDGRLLVYDLNDGGQPTLLTSVDAIGRPENLVSSGDLLYLAAMQGGLRIFDISDPAAPDEIGVYLAPDDVRDVAVLGLHAYVAVQGNGLRVVDVSNPSTPFEVGAVTDEPIAVGVAAAPGFAYLGAHYGGLRIIDVSNPAAPVDIAGIGSPGGAGDVAVAGDLVFFEEGQSGLVVVDVSDPHNPVTVGSYDSPGDIRHLRVAGDRLYVADDEAGVESFEAAGCTGGAPIADFTWSPVSPEVGEVVQFTDLSTELPTSWLWQLGDGTTATTQNPTHTYLAAGIVTVSLSAANSRGSDTTTRTLEIRAAPVVPPITDPGEHVIVVPAAANAPGVAGTSWVTDMVLHNPGVTDAAANLYFMAAGTDNTAAIGHQVEVAAGTSLRLADVVASVFASTGTGGAVLIGSDQVLLVSSRTFNNAASGTYGQYIPGLPVAAAVTGTAPATLVQLTGNDRFRTNIGIANPTPAELHATIELAAADGGVVGHRQVTVRPFGWGQLNGIVASIAGQQLDDARATITATEGGARYFCYGSVVDNRSGDPVYIAPGAVSSEALYVTAAAHVAGANQTSWRTDLEIVNPGSQQTEVTVELLRANRPNTSPQAASRTIGSAAGVRLVDVLDQLFQASGAGALRVTGAGDGVMVTSRTYNDLVVETYGQYIPAVAASTAWHSGDTPRLVQLAYAQQSDAGFRTNIGVVNTTGLEIVVTVELFRGNGDRLGEVPMTLPPYAYHQENDILRAVAVADLPDAFAIVRSTTPDAGYLCYASVVDNRSGDPVYVPGR